MRALFLVVATFLRRLTLRAGDVRRKYGWMKIDIQLVPTPDL
jgi:hypothetical protein